MSGYTNFRPHYEPYRDERRDPRIRPVDIERRNDVDSTDRLYTPAVNAKKETSNQPSNDVDINERQSGLQKNGDGRYSRKLNSESPTTTSIMKIPTSPSIVETPDKTSVSRILTIGKDISDPFTCNLMDDDGKRCVRDFSGVSRVVDWHHHLKELHHKLGSGTFTTKNNLGQFAALAAEPNVAVRDKPVEILAAPPVANASSPPGLGKSSLKRRKTLDENSDDTTKETTVIAKRRRTTEDVVSKNADLATVLAIMHSLKSQPPPQNSPVTAQSLPSKISSVSRESPQSPPPPPPSPPPPPLPELERADKHFNASPTASTLSLPNLSGSPLAEDRMPSIPPSLTFETTNLTPMVTSPELTSTNGQLINPITVIPESLSSRKPYISEMHRSGFSPEDIQKALKKHHNIDLSYEVLHYIVAEYNDSIPLQTTSRPLPSTAPVTRPRSRSSSTTASSIPGIKHESPLHESLPDPPLVLQTSNIFIPLDDLSTEQGLTALESLQSLLPGKIEQLRLKLQEEQAEKERLRKEEEDKVVNNHLAEIKTKLDELDKMKRGDAFDVLNKEIEQKRLGLNGRSTESPDIPEALERSVETAMLVDEIAVPQANQPESIASEGTIIEPIQRDFGERMPPSFVEEPEKMDIEPVHAEEKDHLPSSNKVSSSECVSQAMEVDSDPVMVSRFDQKPPHLSEMDEIIIKEEESSTNDSRSPSIGRHSPEQEITPPSVTRRVSFVESTQTRKITPNLRRNSRPSLHETGTESRCFDDKSMSPETSPISPSMCGRRPRQPALTNLSQSQTGILAPIAYHGLSNPATVLLTNTFDEWSNFCVGLGGDGIIDLLDSRLHATAKGRTMVWDHEYTGSCAINGAWIGPGELALIDKDVRRNREGAQITLVKYMDTKFSTRPQIIPLRKSPHSNKNKITAITPLWIKGERRSFATGDENGELYLWQLARDSSVDNNASIHKHFVERGIGALTYNSDKRWLLSSAKSRLQITDMVKQTDAGEFIQANHIVSISPNPVRQDLTVVGIRDRLTALALLDHRLPSRKAVVETCEYPIRMSDTLAPPWNHSGTWKPNCGGGNYFILGGFSDVHIWDIRRPLKPVSSINLGLGDRMILSTKIIGDELLAMSRHQLAWAKLDDFKLS